jgi:hypothetical protein
VTKSIYTLSIDELKEDLNLRYERRSSKSESTEHGGCPNCGKLGHKPAHSKSKVVMEDKMKCKSKVFMEDKMKPSAIIVINQAFSSLTASNC